MTLNGRPRERHQWLSPCTIDSCSESSVSLGQTKSLTNTGSRTFVGRTIGSLGGERRRWMKWSKGIAALAALLVISGCAKKSTQAAGPPQSAPLVTVAPATAHDVPVYLEEIGRSGAFESVTVTPQISGKIIERHFQDGAELKKDQLLFTIDPRPYQAQLDSAQAQLAQSKAALDLAKTQLKMYDSIANTRAVSQLDVETKKNTVAVDEAQVQAAEADVENAKLNLEYCYIHST